jgi:hypothetical protein
MQLRAASLRQRAKYIYKKMVALSQKKKHMGVAQIMNL